MRSCRRAIAVALQTGVANQIHSAGKPPALAAEVSYAARAPQGATAEDTLEDTDFEDILENGLPQVTHAATPGEAAAAAGA